MTGYMYNETIGKLHFWVTFIGVNIVFFPQHFLVACRHAAALCRLSRRLLWLELRLLDRLVYSGLGVLIFLYGMVFAFVRQGAGREHPWGPGATTLRMDAVVAAAFPINMRRCR